MTALIRPSGCDKSTFIRSLNRMTDIVSGARIEGAIRIDERTIYDPSVDVVDLRRRVGMVFQKSNPFAKSIFEHVAYGLRINRLTRSVEELSGRVETSLKAAVRRSERSPPHVGAGAVGRTAAASVNRARARRRAGNSLDGRTGLSARPNRHAADRGSDLSVQEPLHDRYRHPQHAAARVSDVTAFFWLGKLVEVDRTNRIFTDPSSKLTEDYVTGRFG